MSSRSANFLHKFEQLDCMTVAKLFNLRGHLQEVMYFPGAATVLTITRPFTHYQTFVNHYENYENFVLVKALNIHSIFAALRENCRTCTGEADYVCGPDLS